MVNHRNGRGFEFIDMINSFDGFDTISDFEIID